MRAITKLMFPAAYTERNSLPRPGSIPAANSLGQ